MYSIDEVIKLTAIPKDVIEHFINLMIKYDLLKNTEKLNDKAIEVLNNANDYKNSNNVTWRYAFLTQIQKEYLNELSEHFIWSKKILLEDLIWKIDTGKVKVSLLFNNSDGTHILNSIIDNFKEISSTYPCYSGSSETNACSSICFLCQGNAYQYYLIGKLNPIALYDNIEKENDSGIWEDIHVFYNDSPTFNIMKCTYIAGGNSSNGLFADLSKTCHDNMTY